MQQILEMILKAQNGETMRQMAGNLGVNENDAQNAVAKLLPALMGGVKQNMSQQGGLGSLLNAIGQGNHGRYMDNPQEVTSNAAISEGNGILGHILGSKDVSRQVAGDAAASVGLDAGVVKKMLPMVAALLMGSLNKQASSSGLMGQLAGGINDDSASGLMGMVSSFLDADNDGSMADDLLGMAKKFL